MSRALTNMLSVYSGRQCIGFIVPRGKSGFEAFDNNDISLGMHPSEVDAAHAISDSSEHEKN